MSAIPGSVRMAGFIAPTDSTDTYPVHDEQYGKGGYRTVADITARNAITSQRRQEGMLVKVLDADGGGTTKFYTLKGGIDDINWIEDLAGAVGTQFKLETADQNMTPATVTGDGQDTGLTISVTPANGSLVLVQLNGVTCSLALAPGDKATSEFYFSGDNGSTARAIANVVAGDKLFFNGAVAGYGLDSTDRISLVYLVEV